MSRIASGDVIKVGKTVELEAMDTPGHTMCHICLRAHGDRPALFCGDTLFNAGAGNCHNGGHPAELYATFADQLDKLPENTQIYPGHDYIANNLGFTLDQVRELLRLADDQSGSCAEVDAIAAAQVTEIDRKLADLQALRSELVRRLDSCGATTIAKCQIIETLSPRLLTFRP